MGENRARSTRAAAAALPMTRRQQKRARQKQSQTAPPRATRPPKPQQSKTAVASRSIETASPPPRAPRPVQRPRKASAVAEHAPSPSLSASDGDHKPAPKVRTIAASTSAPRHIRRQAVDAIQLDPDVEAEVAAPPRDTTQPIPELEIEAEDISSPVAPDEAPTQARKYPTLATIAAVRRPAQATEDPENAETADQEPADQGTTTSALPRWRVSESASDAPVSVADRPGAPSAVAPRQPVATRRLQATRDDAAIASFRREARHAETDDSSAARPLPRQRPHPLADIDLTLPVAGAHAAVAAVSALSGAALLIQGASGAIWPLMLTAIAGSGGWLAYILAQQRRFPRAAGAVLMLSQLGVLVWLMLVLGPRGALVALTPAIALLALRISGLLVAACGGALAVGAYLLLSLLAGARRLQPAARLSDSLLIAVDVAAVGVGVFVCMIALNLWNRQHTRLDQQARSRLQEARSLSARSAQEQRRLDEDVQRLDDALATALRGNGVAALPVSADLESLAESVALVAERLQTLQGDREDRLRIEGALRGLIREVERAWLGLPWAWPAPSGTTLDELVALLRAPRSHEAPPSWPDETPTLIPIPSAISQPTRPWDVVSQGAFSRNSRPREGFYSQLPLGLDESEAARSMPVYASQLPWREWDMWRDWDPNQPQVVGE